MSGRVLVSCLHLQRTIDRYRSRFEEAGLKIEMPEIRQQLLEDELLGMIDRFDGVIAGDDQFSAKVLEAGKKLKVVAKWGIGVDAIDQDAAKRLGIHVFNTPGVFPNEVADVAIGYVILLARRLHELDRSVRADGWEQIRGTTLSGKTMGVIGVGSIGQAAARRGRALGMDVVGYDLFPPPAEFLEETATQMMDLPEVLERADFLTLCCNLTADNHHLIDAAALAQMKEGSFLVNVARGPLVDEKALVAALESGHLTGAALDVFEEEPLPDHSGLRKFDRCIFGTHNSSNTLEAILRCNDMAIDNLLRGLAEPLR